MTTRYDAYPDHPLYGVPQEVLDAAREVMDEAVEVEDIPDGLSHPLADAVVMRMHKAGFITWPGKGVAHIHGVESPEERERRSFATEPTISRYPLLDFGVEHADHVVLPDAITKAQRDRHPSYAWVHCKDTEPHQPHQMSYDPWRACPGHLPPA